MNFGLIFNFDRINKNYILGFCLSYGKSQK